MPPQKPPEFGPSKILQRAYERGIRAITGRVLLRKKPEQSFSDWLTDLAKRSQEKDIQDASDLLATRMITAINVGNQKTWRQAAAKSTQSQKLYRLLQAEMAGPTGSRVQQLIRENSRLISSLPLTAAQTLTDEIQKVQQSGARPKTISKMLQKRFPELLKSRTNLISRTETSKAAAALTRARSEQIGIDWYIWETSHDQRTRKSHKNMNGVVVPFSQPPSPEALIGEPSGLGHYDAGSCPNCRCLTLPVLTLADIKFPARVYWNGSIKTMTKQQFKQIAVGLEDIKA